MYVLGDSPHLFTLLTRFLSPQSLPSDPMNEGSQAHGIVMATRKRKGLKYELPVFENYYDKL